MCGGSTRRGVWIDSRTGLHMQEKNGGMEVWHAADEYPMGTVTGS